jgi:hypothetical protein
MAPAVLSISRREILVGIMSASSWAISGPQTLAFIPMVRLESIVDRAFQPWLDLTAMSRTRPTDRRFE